jgi:hypothetical protein
VALLDAASATTRASANLDMRAMMLSFSMTFLEIER